MSKPSRLRAPLFTAIMIAVPFLVLEIAVRLVHLWVPLYEDKTDGYIDHPQFHHWHTPRYSTVSRTFTGEFAVPIRTNSFGMPGGEVSMEKATGTRRIVILGDSFAEGFTTPEDKTIASQLQSLVDRGSSGRYEVLNFGCSSHSPSVEFFSLAHLASRFHPDIVVLLFHFTDVTDDWGYMPAAVRDDAGQIIAVDGRKQKSSLYRTAEYSALLRVIVQRLKASAKRSRCEKGLDLTQTFEAMFKDRYDDRDCEAWRVTQGWLDRVRDWCAQRRVPFVLAVVPVGPQLEPVTVHASQRYAFYANGKILQSTKMQDILREWAERSQVPFCDMLPHAKAYKIQHPSEMLFYPLDQHFTVAGNDMAALAVFDCMRQHAIIGPLHDSDASPEGWQPVPRVPVALMR